VKKVLFVILMASAVLNVYSDIFTFKYTKGEKYRFVTSVTERVSINGRFSHNADILDKISVEVSEVRGNSAKYLCNFQTSERAYGRNSTYKLSDNYLSVFWRDAQGHYTIDPQYFMPVVRNVPIFPKNDLKEGDTWTAKGEEVHDLRRNFGINDAFHFPVLVNYTYKGRIEKNGKELAVIGIDYSVFYKVKYKYQYSNTVPSVITGYSHQTYYWDNDAGKPESYEEEFDFIYHLTSGDYVEYQGTASGKVIHTTDLDKEKAVAKIKKQIREKNIPNATVKADSRGVTINLKNIHFPPDSPVLVPSEREKLRKIGAILKQYPERDILITGHTARIGTEKSCQILSEQRAKAVGDYLLSIGAKSEMQMTFQGKGSREPAADNSTEEGRKLNRRVEITILEN